MSKKTSEELNQELLDLIKKNPSLPIVYFAYSDDMAENRYVMMKSKSIEVGTIYESNIDEQVYTSKEDYVETLCNHFAEDEKYLDLSNEDFESQMNTYADECPHYQAIIVYIECENEEI